MNEIDYKIRSAVPIDRSRLASLIHFGSHAHQHLDWKPPLDWIGSKPYLVMEKEGDIAATLACPPELPEIAWIRLFAVSSFINLGEAWRSLWNAAIIELSQIGKIRVAAISLQSWFNELLEESEFDQTDNVVVLIREGSIPLPNPSAININIRLMLPEDLDLISEIDHDAFDTVWKNSPESLALAYEQSSHASVAEFEDEIVGYQYSTTSSMGAHLARLAVKKKMQGKGIGYLLVYQLLNQFRKQGVEHVTVNTQKNNVASLALYSKAGFNITGESYRVYQHIIDK
jgi:ribosomal protein S18 acetylase RimI-like enzyme